MCHKANTKWSEKARDTWVGVCGPGNLIFTTKPCGSPRLSQLPPATVISIPVGILLSPEPLFSLFGLKNSSYSGLSFSTQISTDQATWISDLHLPAPVPALPTSSPTLKSLPVVPSHNPPCSLPRKQGQEQEDPVSVLQLALKTFPNNFPISRSTC